jgi:hypothetical protein
VLIFGDVEPDSLSAIPRTHLVWSEAAPKIAQGTLAGIFIECSYSDAQGDAMLFGHLVPRHLIAELCTLAEMVAERRRDFLNNGSTDRKRKRQSMGITGAHSNAPPANEIQSISPGSGKQRRVGARPSHLQNVTEENGSQSVPIPLHTPSIPDTPVRSLTLDSPGVNLPLSGLTVVVIHVKDDMRDGPYVGDVILKELKAHDAKLTASNRGLGCEFLVSRSGESYYF